MKVEAGTGHRQRQVTDPSEKQYQRVLEIRTAEKE
jgi:hypothetical protein